MQTYILRIEEIRVYKHSIIVDTDLNDRELDNAISRAELISNNMKDFTNDLADHKKMKIVDSSISIEPENAKIDVDDIQ